LRQLRKRKSKRPLNPKPIGLWRMLFLVLRKSGRKGFARIQLRVTLHQIQTLTQLFLSLTVQCKKRYMTLIVSSALVIFLKTTMEKAGYNVRNVSDGHTHFVLVWRKFLFLRLAMDY
jgi:hypothetical protein